MNAFHRHQLAAEPWSLETVQLRLREAAETLRALRVQGMRPATHRTNWPDIVQDFWEAYGAEEERTRPGRPSPEKITRMDEAIAWLFWIEDRNKRLVCFGRASGIRARFIAQKLGIHTNTVRNWNREACEIILRRLRT